MSMTNMATDSDSYPEISSNPYGYGLCISLNEEQVEALGLNKNPPAAGSKVGITAIAVVRRVSQEADPASEQAEGEPAGDVDVCLEFQITDMEIKSSVTSSAASSMLYGSDTD